MSKRATKKPSTARRASRKIRYETGRRNLTSQAGLVPVVKFLDALGFGGVFHRHVRRERGPSVQYDPVDAGVFGE